MADALRKLKQRPFTLAAHHGIKPRVLLQQLGIKKRRGMTPDGDVASDACAPKPSNHALARAHQAVEPDAQAKDFRRLV